MSEFNRREVINRVIGLGLGSVIGSQLLAADECAVTPPQGEGPYYPEKDLNRDNDLIQLSEKDPQAQGEVILLKGIVQDVHCRPIKDAMVEIWQACYSGKYNHSDDPNDLPLDRQFQYWGRTRTNDKGEYLFRTVIPGHYPVGGGRYRPPHIHIKAHASGFQSLTTQSYFDPESYDDLSLKALVAKLNRLENVDKRLLVLYQREGNTQDPKVGRFDITLRVP